MLYVDGATMANFFEGPVSTDGSELAAVPYDYTTG
jgi:hypothetical protein